MPDLPRQAALGYHEVVWELAASSRPDLRVRAQVFADCELLEQITTDCSLEQLQNVATLPRIAEAALAMPEDLTALAPGQNDVDWQLEQLGVRSAVDDEAAKPKVELGPGAPDGQLEASEDLRQGSCDRPVSVRAPDGPTTAG